MYFGTNGLSGMYVGWMPDFYGRRKTLLYSLAGCLLFQFLLLIGPFYWFRIFCYVCLALCNVKNGCSYAYLFETSGASNKLFVGNTVNAFDRSTEFWLGFIIIFFSRWWIVVGSVYWLLGIAAWIIIYFCMPESPNWHMMNNRNE